MRMVYKSTKELLNFTITFGFDMSNAKYNYKTLTFYIAIHK